MDAAFLETSDEFEHQSRRTRLEREEVGVRYRYSNIQPTSATAIYKFFIVKRLEISLQYFLDDGGTEILWIQGEVKLVPDGKKIQISKVDNCAIRTARL